MLWVGYGRSQLTAKAAVVRGTACGSFLACPGPALHQTSAGWALHQSTPTPQQTETTLCPSPLPPHPPQTPPTHQAVLEAGQEVVHVGLHTLQQRLHHLTLQPVCALQRAGTGQGRGAWV